MAEETATEDFHAKKITGTTETHFMFYDAEADKWRTIHVLTEGRAEALNVWMS
ncbi:hypothetical protein [Microbacterium sp. KR10-403]|uniref:hypothetical protein n=1 Tax=Microbacterium sp. KR10-403 TaxID=3158581 RepID=UPI0032E4D59B